MLQDTTLLLRQIARTFPARWEVKLQLLCQLLRLLEEQQVPRCIKGRYKSSDNADDGLKQRQPAAVRQVKLFDHPLPRPAGTAWETGTAVQATYEKFACRTPSQ